MKIICKDKVNDELIRPLTWTAVTAFSLFIWSLIAIAFLDKTIG